MKVIGIDLGTTNTVAAMDGEVYKTDVIGGAVLPSVVAFPPDGGRQVGTTALRRRPIDAKNTIYSTKRVIGKKWFTNEIHEFRKRYPFHLEADPDGWPMFLTRSGSFSPTDVATMILEKVCLRASIAPGKAMGIVTVPSRFREPEREATREAASMAGLGEVVLLDEPTATALAYRSTYKEEVKLAAVYDLGGGTFDLAVVDCSRPKVEVLAHGGDLYLGGDDLDLKLADWVAKEVLVAHQWDLRSDNTVWGRLIFECEQAKIRLCRQSETTIDLTRVDPASPFASVQLPVGLQTLEELSGDMVSQTFLLCDEVMQKAGVTPPRLDALFVAGGASQLPFVQRQIEQYFGKPVSYAHNPMLVVAIGASLAANQLKV